MRRPHARHPRSGTGSGLSPNAAAEALAHALRTALPDADPFEVDADALAHSVAAAGADPADDALVAAALVAWESLIH